MRYTKFAISKAISAIKNNRFLNIIIDTIYTALELFVAVLELLVKIIISPIGAMAVVAVIGFYMFPTLLESVSTSVISTNMSSSTSVTSVVATTDALSSSLGMVPVLIIAIAGIFPLLFIMRLISGDTHGGVF